MSNKYINAIMTQTEGSSNFGIPSPFARIDKKKMAEMSEDERKAYALKQGMVSGLTVGAFMTLGSAWVAREKGAVIESSDGYFMNEDDFMDYEETGARFKRAIKPSFTDVFMNHKLELASVFTATTGIIGLLVKSGIDKGE